MPLDDQQSIYLVAGRGGGRQSGPGAGSRRPARRWRPTPARRWATRATTRASAAITQAFNELVDSVDFPKFVADLLKAVFDANLKVMKQQTDTYIKLMKEATKSTADFIKKVKDDESFAKLAESKSDQYNVTTEKRADGSTKLAPDDPAGRQGRPRGRRGQAAHPRGQDQHGQGAPRRAARGAADGRHPPGGQEGRDRGGRRVQRQGDAREQGAPRRPEHQRRDACTWTTSRRCSGSSAGRAAASTSPTRTSRSTRRDKKATDDLSATLKGKVKIEFKTDYFKLDNFATMYADGGVAALKPPGGAPGAPPAPPARRALGAR